MDGWFFNSSSADAGPVTGLFPPQGREWGLPIQARQLSPKAAERVALEAATGSFAEAARKVNHDWGTAFDAKQVQRWSEGFGRQAAAWRDQQARQCASGQRPPGPANDPVLLVVEMDGGRVQGREKNPDTGSRWKEDKILAVSTYLPGDGKDKEPVKLTTTYVATMGPSDAFGLLARAEAERRGIRQAAQTILINDGGPWIGTQHDEHFFRCPMIIDWYHAAEHLHDVARAVHGQDEAKRQALAERLKNHLWRGRHERLMGELQDLARQTGPPRDGDEPGHPRRVLAQNLGYFEGHRQHMDYPTYRARGWTIGSGAVEAGVKQFNQRVKGTDRFWNLPGCEAILALRALWLSQDQRWDHYWQYDRLQRKAA
jgi:hypothetical protein